PDLRVVLALFRVGRPPLVPMLFPYTTLFRSLGHDEREADGAAAHAREGEDAGVRAQALGRGGRHPRHRDARGARQVRLAVLEGRSEEHTSELQSRENLVCRLLLEKKNYYHDT